MTPLACTLEVLGCVPHVALCARKLRLVCRISISAHLSSLTRLTRLNLSPSRTSELIGGIEHLPSLQALEIRGILVLQLYPPP